MSYDVIKSLLLERLVDVMAFYEGDIYEFIKDANFYEDNPILAHYAETREEAEERIREELDDSLIEPPWYLWG